MSDGADDGGRADDAHDQAESVQGVDRLGPVIGRVFGGGGFHVSPRRHYFIEIAEALGLGEQTDRRCRR